MGRMKLMVERTHDDMSAVAASLLLGKMYRQGRVNMSITAGSTPATMYETMIPLVRGRSYLDNVYYYNFDEIPLPGEEHGVTMSNLRRLYFEPAEIRSDRIVAFTPENYRSFMDMVRGQGGLDVMVMGLGADGHFCGNLPHVTEFADEVKRVSDDATPTMRDILLGEVGGDESKRPSYYVTLGPRAVMETRELVMIASGVAKAAAVKGIVEGPVTLDLPASVLKLHPHFTLIVDEAAASLLT